MGYNSKIPFYRCGIPGKLIILTGIKEKVSIAEGMTVLINERDHQVVHRATSTAKTILINFLTGK